TYYNYHFRPPGDNNTFRGIGDHQTGVEVMGHSDNSYTRYSVAVIGTNNGQQGLTTSQAVDVFANFTQAFEVPRLGLQHIGVYGYVGNSPTYFQTSNGTPIPGTGS